MIFGKTFLQRYLNGEKKKSNGLVGEWKFVIWPVRLEDGRFATFQKVWHQWRYEKEPRLAFGCLVHITVEKHYYNEFKTKPLKKVA